MAITVVSVDSIYANTEVLKTKIDAISQKIVNEELSIKNLQEQVKRLESPPMIG